MTDAGRVAQIPRERLLDNPRALAILDGDERGFGLTTFMGGDRRLVAYPCRKGTLLNIVAIVVSLSRRSLRLSSPGRSGVLFSAPRSL